MRENTAVKLARMEEREKGMADDIKAILAQTTATNGRVRKLENWRNRIIGAIAILIVVIGWVITYLK
jgi:hypothetical protein